MKKYLRDKGSDYATAELLAIVDSFSGGGGGAVGDVHERIDDGVGGEAHTLDIHNHEVHLLMGDVAGL